MRRNWVRLFIALILFIPIGFLQVSIDYSKKLENLESNILLMPGQMAGSLVLSGFKGLAADLLWLNIENYWHSGQHYKMLPLFEAIAWLQPNYIIVWAVGGWHMSYNVFSNVRSRGENFYEEFKKIEGNIKDKSLKEKAERIVGEIKNLIDGLSRDYEKTDKKIGEYFSITDRCLGEIEVFKENKENKKLYELLYGLINVPVEMIFWYRNGISFLKKGIAYNPDRYDLYFELGWTYYHKGRDYPNAVRYLEKATKFPHPEYVDDVLAHAYEKNGQIQLAIKQWEKLLGTSFDSIAKRAIETLKKGEPFTP
jgi:tetratricopeptide (TPR) repeat protein